MTDVHIRLGGPLQVLHRRQQDLMELLREKDQTIETLQQEKAALEEQNRHARASLLELQARKDVQGTYTSQLSQEVEEVAHKLRKCQSDLENCTARAEFAEQDNVSLQKVADECNAKLEQIRNEKETLQEKYDQELKLRQKKEKDVS